jgi:putative aldouronate transport system substrate-binding protein
MTLAKKSIAILVLLAMTLAAPLALAADTYPMAPVTLTYWAAMHTNCSPIVTNYADLALFGFLEEATGVKLEFIHPAIGSETEAFNLMIASNELPDIIENAPSAFPGGPAGALKNNIIMELSDVFEQYCPNLMAMLEANPEIDKMIKTDDQQYYAFPYIRQQSGDTFNAYIGSSWGPTIRYDWLTEAGLAVPGTIAEWHDVLTAMKARPGVEAPFTGRFSDLEQLFIGAFGGQVGFYVDGGQVKYSILEPGRYDFLKTMHDWYAEGLIDANITTNNAKAVETNMISGRSFAARASGGSYMGVWIPAGRVVDENYDLMPVAYPSLNAGEEPTFTNGNTSYSLTNIMSVYISTQCENVEAAARFLDFGYSPEGNMIYNYGKEGVSYEMVDGQPVLMDFIFEDETVSVASMIAMYSKGHMGGPFLQQTDLLNQFYTEQRQKEALDTWKLGKQKEYILPPITPSEDETSEFTRIMNEVNTYVDEMTVKFLLGTESLDGFDAFIAELHEIGIDRALEIYQAAYDRYMNR